MKKIFYILLIVFFSSPLFAGVNEPGSGYVNGYTEILKGYERELKSGAKKKTFPLKEEERTLLWKDLNFQHLQNLIFIDHRMLM